MKGRETKGLGIAKGRVASADLLVCFPSRAHLSLMPKPICSPSRPSEPNKRHHHHHPPLKKINTSRFGGGGGGGGPGPGPASPLLWAKNKGTGPEISEPTSPKVTCAGQIKVRPRASGACRNWQSVMEEIERIHNRSKLKKKSTWTEALGFKKDVMNFLTCLRNLRFDFRCFGSFPEPDITSDDDDEEEEVEEEESEIYEEAGESDQGNAVFSKWFMVLQDNQQSNNDNLEKEIKHGEEDDDVAVPAVPPPNALLLMRCRSAPAKQRSKETEVDTEDDDDVAKSKQVSVVVEVEEESDKIIKKKKRESLAIVMKYDTDFYNLSTDVAQETWVVGGFKDPFSRSRSWKR